MKRVLSPAATRLLASGKVARTGRRTLRALEPIVSAIFLLTGSGKLAGVPIMVATFEHLGMGQWLRYLAGGVEVAGALALLAPTTAALGAIALAGVMLGAVGAHLLVIEGSSVPALVLLGLATGIAWARRGELPGRLLGVHPFGTDAP